MTFDFDGIPEIIAKVASKTDNETVKEKWEELRTLVHLVHKDEILRQRKKLDDWKQGMDDVNRKISNLQQTSWGIGVEESDFGVDYTFTGSGDLGSVSMGDYGVTAMTTTFDHDDDTDNQMILNFPMTEEEEYANAGYSKEHIKQMQDPKHNQWGAAGEPKKN